MRMNWKIVLPAACLMLMAAFGVRAHHSFTATYFEDREITIEGKLLQFMFRNPHSFVHIEAPDANGVDNASVHGLGIRRDRGRPTKPCRVRTTTDGDRRMHPDPIGRGKQAGTPEATRASAFDTTYRPSRRAGTRPIPDISNLF